MSAESVAVVAEEPEYRLASAVRRAEVHPLSSTRPHAAQPRRSSGVDWVDAENTSQFSAAEEMAQGGAGALILAVAIAELVLGVWTAGWWQRALIVVLAAVGAFALTRTAAAYARGATLSDQ